MKVNFDFPKSSSILDVDAGRSKLSFPQVLSSAFSAELFDDHKVESGVTEHVSKLYRRSSGKCPESWRNIFQVLPGPHICLFG